MIIYCAIFVWGLDVKGYSPPGIQTIGGTATDTHREGLANELYQVFTLYPTRTTVALNYQLFLDRKKHQ